MKTGKKKPSVAQIRKIKADALARRTRRKRPAISKREEEILKLLCDELSSVEIGGVLGLSEKTISNYLTGLLRKTKSKNRIGLVKYSIQYSIYKLNSII